MWQSSPTRAVLNHVGFVGAFRCVACRSGKYKATVGLDFLTTEVMVGESLVVLQVGGGGVGQRNHLKGGSVIVAQCWCSFCHAH